MSIEDGGPAFPQGDDRMGHEGMSLRDYFAAQALTGLLGRAWDHQNKEGIELMKLWASSAYVLADAMLEARASLPSGLSK